MQDLIESIEALKNGDLRRCVDARIQEFKTMRDNPVDVLFQELCFCILTANCSAERCIRIQNEINQGFLVFSEEELGQKLKTLGYRFPPRARHIIVSRQYCSDLPKVLRSFHGEALREWLVEHVDGLGYKEASHFLRNIGFDDFAIIDSHIVDVLVKNGLITQPKTLTKRVYLEIEQMLKKLAKQVHLSLAELDLYLWYMETGKVLK